MNEAGLHDGVRHPGLGSCGTKPAFANLYYRDADCTEIWRTNIAAFQQLWFAIDSAQLGVAGASKWDAYWAVYDINSVKQQVYWLTGPPWERYPLTPSFHALSLLNHVTVPGWRILRVLPWDDSDWLVPNGDDGQPIWDQPGGNASADQPEQELVAYSGPNDEYTIMGLDTRGRELNGISAEPPSAYSIGGLPAEHPVPPRSVERKRRRDELRRRHRHVQRCGRCALRRAAPRGLRAHDRSGRVSATARDPTRAGPRARVSSVRS